MPPFEPESPPIDRLADICGWFGTYRERLRVARGDRRNKKGAVAAARARRA